MDHNGQGEGEERIEAMMQRPVAPAGKKDGDNGDYAEGYGGAIQ